MIWKEIIDFPKYSISEDGQVKNNRTNRTLTPNISGNDPYLRVSLYNNLGQRKTVAIHRLLAIAFIPKIEGCDIVNHIDGNKLNNKLENLEWTTILGNKKHAMEKLGVTRCENAGRPKRPVQQIKNNEVVGKFESAHDAANKTNSNFSKICMVCRGERRTHNGYEWRYVDEQTS